MWSPACQSSSDTTTCLNRCTRPIRTDAPSSTTAPSIPSASCCAPARSPRTCTTRRGTSRHSSPSPGSTSSAACRWCDCLAAAVRSDLTDAQVDARRRVGKALDALGGLRQPGRHLRLARRRAAALDPRVGDAAGLGRQAGAGRAGAGDPGGGVGDVGGLLWIRTTIPTRGTGKKMGHKLSSLDPELAKSIRFPRVSCASQQRIPSTNARS